LYVYDSVDAAVADTEALDAQETFVEVYDQDSVPLRIEWIRPNTSENVLPFVSSVSNGEYTLVPAGAPDKQGLLAVLRRAEAIDPISAEGAVRELERHLANRGM
ncbi:MAG: hypothetical protein ACR2NU_15130, partial [Aeoliella sp.]